MPRSTSKSTPSSSIPSSSSSSISKEDEIIDNNVKNSISTSYVSIALIIGVVVSIIAAIAAMNPNIINSINGNNSKKNGNSNIIITIELSDSLTKHDVHIDLLKYSIASTTEDFCRQRFSDGLVSSMQDVATQCVPVIQNFLVDKLSNDFKLDPNSIIIGKYSDEIRSFHTTSTSATSSTTVSTNNDEKKTLSVPIIFNDASYTLDLTEPIILFTSSETFCRYVSDTLKIEETGKLPFLGECVIPVAEKVMEQLVSIHSYPESQIERGEFSVELKLWAEQALKEKNASEKQKPSISIPIKWDNDITYTVDLAEPIVLYPAAESFCRYMLGELNVVDTEYFQFLKRCLEPVVDHLIDQLENTHNISKENIFTGDFSSELKEFYADNMKIQEQQQQPESP